MKLLDNLGLSRFLSNCDNRFASKNHTHSGVGGGLTPVEFERFDVGEPNTYIYYLGASTTSALYTAIVANVDGVPSSGGLLYNYATLQMFIDSEASMDNVEQSSPPIDIDGWLFDIEGNKSRGVEFTAYIRLLGVSVTDESMGMPIGSYIEVQNQYKNSNPNLPPERPFKIVKLFKQEVA